MGEKINNEFDKFQEELKKKEKRLKLLLSFDVEEDLDVIVDELKKKEIVL